MTDLHGKTLAGTFVHAPTADGIEILEDALVAVGADGVIASVIASGDPSHAASKAEASRVGRLVSTPSGSMTWRS